jgi:hypothetical protein
MSPPPHPRALKLRPAKEKIIILNCPTCGRGHRVHPEFGPFCCLSCLQTPLHPLIVIPEKTYVGKHF